MVFEENFAYLEDKNQEVLLERPSIGKNELVL